MNRLKDMQPIHCMKIAFNSEERAYLWKLARSSRPYDKRLCLDYLGSSDEIKKNQRFLLEVSEILAQDLDRHVAGQALIQLEMFATYIDHRKVWPVALRLCSSSNTERREQAAITILEYLLRDHFDFFYPRIERQARLGNLAFIAAISTCFFDGLTPSQFDRYDRLFKKYLPPDRLAGWEEYLPYYRGEKKCQKKPREDECAWHAPARGKNRLQGRDPVDFWRHHVELNSTEKVHLRALAESPRFRDRVRCLEFLIHLISARKNGDFILEVIDQLIPDRNPLVRGNAIFLLEEYIERVDRLKGWKAAIRHGSSSSADIRNLIARSPLQELLSTDPDEFISVAEDVVQRGNRNFALTLSECWFHGAFKGDLNRMDLLLSEHLRGKRLRVWKDRLRLYRTTQNPEPREKRGWIRERLIEMRKAT